VLVFCTPLEHAHPLRAGRSLLASSKKPCLQLAYRGRQPSSALIFALEAPRRPSDHPTMASPTIRRATKAGTRGGRLAPSAFLHDVLGLRDAAEHPVGYREQERCRSKSSVRALMGSELLDRPNTSFSTKETKKGARL